MDNDSLAAVSGIAFGIVGLGIIVWLFVRERKQQGIAPFKLTDEDHVQIRDLRRELNPWRLLSGFLGAIGGLAALAGIASVFGLDSSGKPDWAGGINCFVFGGILISLAVLLSRRFK